MATTNTINFVEQGGKWVAKFQSLGDSVIQLDRAKPGEISILVNIEGMSGVPVVRDLSGWTDASVIFRCNVPIGLEVTIRSWSEVRMARVFVQEDLS